YGDIDCGSEVLSIRSFHIEREAYVAIADRDNDAVLIYKWHDQTFIYHQTIDVPAVLSLEIFRIHNDTYLGTAAYRTGSIDTLYQIVQIVGLQILTQPVIYKWKENESTFIEFQRLNVLEAKTLKFVEFSQSRDITKYFLIATNGSYANTTLYEWDSDGFGVVHHLHAKSKHVAFIQENYQFWMILTSDRGTTVWKWTGQHFYVLKSASINLKAPDSVSLDTANFHHITFICMVDKRRQLPVYITKWHSEQEQFILVENLKHHHATTCQFVNYAGQLYLLTGSRLGANIYKYDQVFNNFHLIDELDGISHVTATEHVNINGVLYLLLKVKSRQYTNDGRVSDVCRYYQGQLVFLNAG
ncbi:leucine-rich repeat LGI family member 2-like, partial [Saccoglossus kowalevskii]